MLPNRCCAAFLSLALRSSAFLSLGAVLFAQTAVPRSSHVVLVVEENTSYNTAAANMPWLVSQGTAFGHATNYFSNTSGSLMDYLWLASGSCESSANCALPGGTHNFGCGGDSCSSPITDDSIWAEMDRLGITWKVYAQSYSAAGGTVTTPDLANGTHYYRRHNGATWYSEILNNVSGSQARIVDFSQFAIDLANNALPQFAVIVPDGLNDAHDGTAAQADNFLQANVAPVLNKPYFQPGGDGLMIITFDNGDADVAGLVYTAVIGPKVKPCTVSNTFYKHENALRTMLDALGITTYPGASSTASPMSDFFGIGGVTIAAPTEGASTGTQVLVTASATEPGVQISQMQVWDNTTGQKLGVINGSSVNQTFMLPVGSHQIVVEDMNTSFQVIHKATVDIKVTSTSSGGVTITSPVEGATTNSQVKVVATATENNTQISQMQVWDNTTGQKLGVINGSSVNQSFTLTAGPHQLVVEDMNPFYQVIHKSTVDITVASGVTVASPGEGAITGPQVTVIANATEASAQISQLQVWDNTTGQKLAVVWSPSMSQTFTLSPGTHQLIVEDMNTSFQVLHKTAVDITVTAP
jgi:acid phosphatase